MVSSFSSLWGKSSVMKKGIRANSAENPNLCWPVVDILTIKQVSSECPK